MSLFIYKMIKKYQFLIRIKYMFVNQSRKQNK